MIPLLRTLTPLAVARNPSRSVSVRLANPESVTFPPPDCAVILRIVAVFPLKIIRPLAFCSPLGKLA